MSNTPEIPLTLRFMEHDTRQDDDLVLPTLMPVVPRIGEYMMGTSGWWRVSTVNHYPTSPGYGRIEVVLRPKGTER